jgi:3-hydroxyisobutyrate dehydrogenase-like beta-hydroxyacid dehydrogenase
MSRVAVLGLGLMGSALARTFVDRGRSPVVWNRSPERSEPFRSLDATVVQTVHDATGQADVIVVCVHDYEASAALLGDPEVAAALTGKVVVQLSSGTPDQARSAGRWAAAHDIGYLDGAIMAFPQAIGTEQAVVLYAGAPDTYGSVSELLADFGSGVFVGADLATAAAIDNSLLSIYYAVLMGTLNGAGICDAFDVPQSTLRDLATALMPTLSDVVVRTLDMVASGDYRSEHSTINTTMGALGHIATVTRDAGVDMGFVACAQGYARRASELGHTWDGPASMFEAMRGSSAPKQP